MRLSTLRIENFRSFKDETIVFDDYTCLVGSNGSGKSTILTALNIFFRNSASSATDLLLLCDEDFHLKDASHPIRITLTFEQLGEEEKTALKAYVRQGKLIVSAKAVFDPSTQRAPVKQVGSRLVMERFTEFFREQENKAKALQLRTIYESIRGDFADLPPPASMDAMRDALRAYEDAHPDKCVPWEAETDFYGWSKGEN